MTFPAQRQPTENERRILAAALEVFAEKGLHGATTQEIGDLAGVGKSTLHYYFRHKDQLYRHLYGHPAVFVLQALAAALCTVDIVEAALLLPVG
ncbi:MAG: helix-turn-helix domain-containing protein [Acidobacteriota bacterium]